MGDTNIEWASKVWNFVRGCRRVSPGCGGPGPHGGCYAERQAIRQSGAGGAYEGLVTLTAKGPRWTGVGRFVAGKLGEPLRTRRPSDGSRHRFFVNSMSDLFFEEFSFEEIAAGFGVMAACPEHDFLILTKRPERGLEFYRWLERQGPAPITVCLHYAQKYSAHKRLRDTTPILAQRWPLTQVWLGISAEDQPRADDRIPPLRECPAAVRFVSLEPLLGPIDIRRFMVPTHWHWDSRYPTPEQALAAGAFAAKKPQALVSAHSAFVEWVIVGGESGPRARPFDVQWAESLRDQCRDAATPFFLKQLGRHPYDPRESDRTTDEPHPDGPAHDPSCRLRLTHRKGADWSEWDEALRIRQFPTGAS